MNDDNRMMSRSRIELAYREMVDAVHWLEAKIEKLRLSDRDKTELLKEPRYTAAMAIALGAVLGDRPNDSLAFERMLELARCYNAAAASENN